MSTAPTDRILAALRELGMLERKRTGEGVTPLEYQRWLDLRERLAHRMAAAPGADPSKAAVTRMRVSFPTPWHLARAQIRELAGGGLFFDTPFAPELGTELELRLRIESTGDELVLPGHVVTNHVGDRFSTQDLGMGVQLHPLAPAVRSRLAELIVRGGGQPHGLREAGSDQSTRSSTSTRR